MADYGNADYGLDPSILQYLQGGGMPADQQTSSVEYPIGIGAGLPGSGIGGPSPAPSPAPPPPQPPPPPPLPPPTTSKGDRSDYPRSPTIIPMPFQYVGPGDAAGGDQLHPAVVNAIQNGFPANPDALAQPATLDSSGYVQSRPMPTETHYTTDLPSTPQDVAKANAAYARRQAAQAVFDASPEGAAQRADAAAMAGIEHERSALGSETQAQTDLNTANAKTQADYQRQLAEHQRQSAIADAQQQAEARRLQTIYQQRAETAANYHVDTSRNLGFRDFMAIALSGIGDALDRRHGPNAAAQIIDDRIDKHVADQWRMKDELGKDADAARSEVNQYLSVSDNERQARALHGASIRMALADELQNNASQYANPMAKARADQQAAVLDQKASTILAGEAQRKAAEQRAAREDADRRAQIAIAGGHLALARRQENFEEGIKTSTLALNSIDRVNDFAAKWQAAREKANEKTGTSAIFGAPEVVRDPKGNVVTDQQGNPQVNLAPVVRQPNDTLPDANQAWIPTGRPEDVSTFRGKQAAVEKLAAATDQLINLRDKYGWTSDLAKSPEWQKMHSLFGNLLLDTQESRGLSRLSEADIGMLKQIAGNVDDPTRFRDPTEGLKQMRETSLDDLNTDAHKLGLRGTLKVPDLTIGGAIGKVSDTNTQQAIRQSQERYQPPHLGIAGSYAQQVSPEIAGAIRGIFDPSADDNGLTANAREGVHALIVKAIHGDKDAMYALQTMERSDPNPNVRSWIEEQVASGFKGAKK